MNSSPSHLDKRILLVYPKVGMSGALVRHMPLSLLYAAIDSLKHNFAIDIVDVRLDLHHWRERITAAIMPDTCLVGISVMTGVPVKSASEISRLVKERFPHVKIVWGGPHATFNSAEILANPDVDYVISGYGSRPLCDLARSLRGDAAGLAREVIHGLSYRREGRIITVASRPVFERVDYREIPYHLIEKNLSQYGQLDTSERIFSLYSVLGCPYQCTFCSSPAQYRPMHEKYVLLDVGEVVDHIEHVHRVYKATYIYFIDDDSFVDLRHVEEIIDEINRRGIRVGLGFRGARINELARMSDAYLSKLAACGTTIMHVGAESGSQRMLDLFGKNCTVNDIIEVNRKMAKHPEIKVGYNWIMGVPGETVQDLRFTQLLMLQLIRENPSALLFIPNRFRPLSGTALYELAVQYGYRKPKDLKGWVNEEAEGEYQAPWIKADVGAMMRMMQVTSFFVDDKAFKVETGGNLKFFLIRLLAYTYRPIARWRLQYGFTGFLIEDRAFRMAAAYFRG